MPRDLSERRRKFFPTAKADVRREVGLDPATGPAPKPADGRPTPPTTTAEAERVARPRAARHPWDREQQAIRGAVQ